MSKLTAKRVRALLDYSPDTGEFRRRVAAGPAKAGTVTGCPNRSGHLIISADNRQYLAHRLAWLWVTGDWPSDGREIDHKDGNPANNRWSNLRLATHRQNHWNKSRHRDNTSGFKGVFLHSPGKYRARISINGKARHLGLFDSAWRAYRAYCTAARQHHGEFRRTT